MSQKPGLKGSFYSRQYRQIYMYDGVTVNCTLIRQIDIRVMEVASTE